MSADNTFDVIVIGGGHARGWEGEEEVSGTILDTASQPGQTHRGLAMVQSPPLEVRHGGGEVAAVRLAAAARPALV